MSTKINIELQKDGVGDAVIVYHLDKESTENGIIYKRSGQKMRIPRSKLIYIVNPRPDGGEVHEFPFNRCNGTKCEAIQLEHGIIRIIQIIQHGV